jgi:CBS domain-containing protein
MLVADIMTAKPVYVRTDERLSNAAQIMWDCDCGAVPVIESGSNRLVGMLTDRDICMATWSRGLAPSAIPVAEAMSIGVVSCRPHDKLAEVEAKMRSSQVRRIPVVDAEQQLVGIVSIADIARSAAARRPLELNGDDLSTDGLASILAGICARERARSELASLSQA